MLSTGLVNDFHPSFMSSGHDNYKSHIFNDKKEQQFVSSFTGGANSVCSSK